MHNLMIKNNKSLKLLILLVEDDPSIAAVVSYNLKRQGYRVIIATDGDQGIRKAQEEKPDIILMDWMLPKKSGLEVCMALREDPNCSSVPIIMISSKNEDLDKVSGLERGADDYITKPFSHIELIARIEAVLRRMRPSFADKKLVFQDIEMDLNSYEVKRNGQLVKLTPIEFKMLQRMMETPNRAISREELKNGIWSIESEVDARTIDVHMTRLRKALRDCSADDTDVITTVRLVGYKLELKK